MPRRYDNWISHRGPIVAKYGGRWYRMWCIFLGWSAIIAAQGSSTVFMITLTKNHAIDKDSVAAGEAGEAPFSRIARWVGRSPIATQQ